MNALLALRTTWAIAMGINLVPAFMPPTRSFLATVHALQHPPLLVLPTGGAISPAIGRVGLARFSGRFRYLLPASDRQNAEALGSFVNRHRRWRAALVFGHCLGPLTSRSEE